MFYAYVTDCGHARNPQEKSTIHATSLGEDKLKLAPDFSFPLC